MPFNRIHPGWCYALVAYCETISRKDLIEWVTDEFACSDRAAADSLSILVQGHWLQRTRDNEDRRRSSYTLTERGRYLLTHPRWFLVLRVARRLFTTCPSAGTKRRQANLAYSGVDAELQRVERLVLVRS